MLVHQPVVHATFPALPEFDAHRTHAVTSPMQGTRYIAISESFLPSHVSLFELLTTVNDPALIAAPGTDAALQRTCREIGVGLRRADLLHPPLDPHLAFMLTPIEEERRTWITLHVHRFAAVVVRVENESIRIERSQQHHAGTDRVAAHGRQAHRMWFMETVVFSILQPCSEQDDGIIAGLFFQEASFAVVHALVYMPRSAHRLGFVGAHEITEVWGNDPLLFSFATLPCNLRRMSSDLLDLDPVNVLPPERGRLLVSGPFLSDPYFRRTVVLLCEHDVDGSFGFVLNRMMETRVNELVPDMPRIHERVSMGGPVNGDNLYFIHTLGMHLRGSKQVVDDVHAGGDHAQLRDLLAADPKLTRHVRFFIGYAGWEAGQLEREIAERSWFVTSGGKQVVMSGHGDRLWRDTLRSMGQAFAPLANFPEDPGLN